MKFEHMSSLQKGCGTPICLFPTKIFTKTHTCLFSLFPTPKSINGRMDECFGNERPNMHHFWNMVEVCEKQVLSERCLAVLEPLKQHSFRFIDSVFSAYVYDYF